MAEKNKTKKIKVKGKLESGKAGWKHFAILLGVGAFLILILFIRTGGNLFKGGKVLGVQSENSSLTYEQLVKEYEAKEQEQVDTALDQFAKDIALIDPDAAKGKVLGVTDDPNGLVPKADQIFNNETLSKIVVKTVSDSEDNYRIYSSAKFIVETHYNVLSFFDSLGSSDSFALQQTADESKKVVEELKSIPVPQSFVTYHRYLLMYYLIINQMAEASLNQDSENQYEVNGLLFMSVTQKLESERARISEEFNVQL